MFKTLDDLKGGSRYINQRAPQYTPPLAPQKTSAEVFFPPDQAISIEETLLQAHGIVAGGECKVRSKAFSDERLGRSILIKNGPLGRIALALTDMLTDGMSSQDRGASLWRPETDSDSGEEVQLDDLIRDTTQDAKQTKRYQHCASGCWLPLWLIPAWSQALPSSRPQSAQLGQAHTQYHTAKSHFDAESAADEMDTYAAEEVRQFRDLNDDVLMADFEQLDLMGLESASPMNVTLEGDAQLIMVLDTSSIIDLQKDDVFCSVFTDLLLNERMNLLEGQDVTMSVVFLIPLRVIFELDGLRKDAALEKAWRTRILAKKALEYTKHLIEKKQAVIFQSRRDLEQILARHYEEHPHANQATDVNSDDQIILTAEEAARQIKHKPFSKVVLVTEDVGIGAKNPTGVIVMSLMAIPSTRDEIAQLMIPEDLLSASRAWEQSQEMERLKATKGLRSDRMAQQHDSGRRSSHQSSDPSQDVYREQPRHSNSRWEVPEQGNHSQPQLHLADFLGDRPTESATALPPSLQPGHPGFRAQPAHLGNPHGIQWQPSEQGMQQPGQMQAHLHSLGTRHSLPAAHSAGTPRSPQQHNAGTPRSPQIGAQGNPQQHMALHWPDLNQLPMEKQIALADWLRLGAALGKVDLAPFAIPSWQSQLLQTRHTLPNLPQPSFPTSQQDIGLHQPDQWQSSWPNEMQAGVSRQNAAQEPRVQDLMRHLQLHQRSPSGNNMQPIQNQQPIQSQLGQSEGFLAGQNPSDPHAVLKLQQQIRQAILNQQRQ